MRSVVSEVILKFMLTSGCGRDHLDKNLLKICIFHDKINEIWNFVKFIQTCFAKNSMFTEENICQKASKFSRHPLLCVDFSGELPLGCIKNYNV